ncbi:MAG: biopolymer transporter ExbD [Ignavibacteriales bacterium]|nr:biopolymer transporter ExbD [Ignavibacteriales bacterium]
MNFRPVHRSRYLESFNFSSLTDVVMQLLIFFLLTFSFANTRGMNVTLPKTAVGQPPQRKTISVSIQKDKNLFVNNEAVTKNQLAAKLTALIKVDIDQQIVIRADKDLTLQDVVEILDIAKGVGATKLFIATEAAKEVK